MSKSKQGQYIVQRGDTVESIAKKLGMSPFALISQNPGIRSQRLTQGRVWYIIARSPRLIRAGSPLLQTPPKTL